VVECNSHPGYEHRRDHNSHPDGSPPHGRIVPWRSRTSTLNSQPSAVFNEPAN
jgi:hypothetical protein